MLAWFKPEEVGNMGLVYVSKCRRFMIICRRDPTEYSLSYVSPKRGYVRVGDYTVLKSAKDAAKEVESVWE